MHHKKGISLLTLLILVSCLIPPSSAPTALDEVWVNGSGGQDATTISQALGMVATGGTIHIMDGIYIENVVINSDVTLKGYGSVRIEPSDGMATIVVNNASVSMSNIYVVGDTECLNASLHDASHELAFESCTFEQGSLPESKVHIEVTNEEYDISFAHCVITGDLSSNGITLLSDASTGTLTLEENEVYDNMYGVYLSSENGSNDSFEGYANVFSFNFNGIRVISSGSKVDVSLERDVFSRQGGSGIYISAPGDSLGPEPSTLYCNFNHINVMDSGMSYSSEYEGDGIFLQVNGGSTLKGTVYGSFIWENPECGIFASCDCISSCNLVIKETLMAINGFGGYTAPLDGQLPEYYGGAIECVREPLVTSPLDGSVVGGAMALDVSDSLFIYNGFGVMGVNALVSASQNDMIINFGPGILVQDGSVLNANSNYLGGNLDGIVVDGMWNPSSAVITNNIIVAQARNEAESVLDGGNIWYVPMGNGVSIIGSDAIVSNNTIAENYANGIFVTEGYAPDYAPLDGECIEDSFPVTIVNNIVVDNGYYNDEATLDGRERYYNIAYAPSTLERAVEVPIFDFFISHNDVWSYVFPNNFSESLVAFEGTFGNISADPLLMGSNALLAYDSPCINAGLDAGRPEYGNVFDDFFIDENILVGKLPDGFPLLDGYTKTEDDTLVVRPQSGVYDIGAQEMVRNDFSIVTYAPVVSTGLFQANALWANILALLPEDLPAETAGEIDGLLAQVQDHIEGAMALSNPIAASGSLQRALALLQQVEAMLA